jgi:DNA-binding transcriptional ArsR family regulator
MNEPSIGATKGTTLAPTKRGRPRGSLDGMGVSSLAALTGSRVAEGVLLVLAANTEAYPAEIAQSLDLPPSAVLAQLRRFEDAEFLVRRNVGRTALYTFNPRGKTAALLKGLVTNVLMQMAARERLRFTFRRRPRSAGKVVVGG